jgi:hypothetical protein
MITFSRTETWASVWRGKSSSTDVLLDGEAVGAIDGAEGAAMSGSMSYTLLLWQAGRPAVHEGRIESLRAAKARARELLSEH